MVWVGGINWHESVECGENIRWRIINLWEWKKCFIIVHDSQEKMTLNSLYVVCCIVVSFFTNIHMFLLFSSLLSSPNKFWILEFFIWQELHKRRLQIKQGSKYQKKSKGFFCGYLYSWLCFSEGLCNSGKFCWDCRLGWKILWERIKVP